MKASTDQKIAPECQHFGVCGGCSLQGLDQTIYVRLKKNLLVTQLALEGLYNIDVNEPELIPAHHRRRCNLKVARKQDQILLGYHEMKSHQIVNIKECPLVTSEIEKLIEPLKACLKHLITGKNTHDIFITQSDCGHDMILDGIKSLSAPQTEKLIAFAQSNNIARVRLKYKGSMDPIIAFHTPTIQYGGVAVECDADAFVQASSLSDKILSELVLKHLPKNCKRVVDLFCGRGTFALPLSIYTKVDAFELDDRAISALQKAANKAQRNIQTNIRNLFDDPLDANELSRYDFAVINPPRAGALKQTKQLAASTIPSIVMVSCDPKTFARDTKILILGGYRLDHVTPVDQFLWSKHIEVVGVFFKG